MSEEKDRERAVVHVRVVADRVVVEEVATLISEMLTVRGYELIEQTGLRADREDPTSGKVFITVR
jgi:hypothetical protein